MLLTSCAEVVEVQPWQRGLLRHLTVLSYTNICKALMFGWSLVCCCVVVVVCRVQIDPTKGKRALSPPTDPKRAADMAQLLAQTSPGGWPAGWLAGRVLGWVGGCLSEGVVGLVVAYVSGCVGGWAGRCESEVEVGLV